MTTTLPEPQVPGPLLVVRWLDHWDRTRWHEQSELDDQVEPVHVESVGFLAAENEETITLQNGVSDHGQTLHSMVIIKRAITERYEVAIGD